MSAEVVRWADRAMWISEPASQASPKVTVVSATADPLGVLAAVSAMYVGRTVLSTALVTDDERREAYANLTKTVLEGPLECVDMVLCIENVTRAITHQMVRTRASFFAQESLRFAVVADAENKFALPPSLQGTKGDGEALGTIEDQRLLWDAAIEKMHETYLKLVNSGMPQEEARGLLPHATNTRIMWNVNLRSLLEVAGKRLCTQAQFEWRVIFGEIARALRKWGETQVDADDAWQWNFIADQMRPLCYQEGHCGFMAKFDRGCTIRERVNANARLERPSNQWHEPVLIPTPLPGFSGEKVEAIRDYEWAADPSAARVRPDVAAT